MPLAQAIDDLGKSATGSVPIRRPSGFTLIELMIVVAIIGLLAAIAIPNFMRFQGRAKKSEVRANLKAAATMETAYFHARDAYSARIDTIGFKPERGNRFAYFFGHDKIYSERNTTDEAACPTCDAIAVDTLRFSEAVAHPGHTSIGAPGPTRPAGVDIGYSILARGNVDNDAAYDDWGIFVGETTNGSGLVLPGGTPVVAGEPFTIEDDLQ